MLSVYKYLQETPTSPTLSIEVQVEAELGADILDPMHSKSLANSSKISNFQSFWQKIATPPPLHSSLLLRDTVKPDGQFSLEWICVGVGFLLLLISNFMLL